MFQMSVVKVRASLEKLHFVWEKSRHKGCYVLVICTCNIDKKMVFLFCLHSFSTVLTSGLQNITWTRNKLMDVFTIYVKLGLIKQNLSPYRRGTCRKHIVTGSSFLKIWSNLQQTIKLLNIRTAEYSLCTHKLCTHGIQSYFADYVSTTQDKIWGGKQTQIWSWLTTLQ